MRHYAHLPRRIGLLSLALIVTSCAQLEQLRGLLPGAATPTPAAPAVPTATSGPPPTPTLQPTATAVPGLTISSLLVAGPDGALAWVPLPARMDRLPRMGLTSRQGSAGDWALGLGADGSAVAASAGGPQPMAGVQAATSLAVDPVSGAAPRFVWGGLDRPLAMMGLDGVGQTTLFQPEPGQQASVAGWSADGQTVSYSLQPPPVDGYQPFASVASLYRMDVGTGVTETIAAYLPGVSQPCIDDLAPDGATYVSHCSGVDLTIHYWRSGQSVTTQPPAASYGWTLIGDARYSLDGRRLAFIMLKGDPGNELSWVAVSDGLSGGSVTAVTGEPGLRYNLVSWIGPSEVLIQALAADGSPSVWVVDVDARTQRKLVDGRFVAFAPLAP